MTIGHWERFVSATRYATQAEKSGGSWAFDWQARKWGHVAGANWLNPGYGESPSPKWPVTCISWQDAVAFCRWLTRVETDKGRLPPGYEYRLPAEGEWERACRGGDSERLFWWGDDVDQARGRLNGSSDDALGGSLAATKWNIGVPWSDGFAWVAPVGAFGASGRNAFGLSDMLGNVSEWCLDGYDPSGAHEAPWYDNTALRVTKGGSFADPPGMLRCANRFGSSASDSFATRGFRVCLGRVRKEPEDPAGTVTSEDGEQDPVADPTDDGP